MGEIYKLLMQKTIATDPVACAQVCVYGRATASLCC